MAIRKIKISNFKSFKDLEIELGNFNVLIGANASGKSNFIQIFKFLRDIANHGLNNAISMQGGVEYLRNIKIGPSKNFSLEVVISRESSVGGEQPHIIKEPPEKISYKITIGFNKREQGFEIIEDVITLEFGTSGLSSEKTNGGENLKSRKIIISNNKGLINVEIFPKNSLPEIEKWWFSYIREIKLGTSSLLSETPQIFQIIPIRKHMHIDLNFRDILICDFDPKLPKKSSPITGKAEIEEDGKNLPIVLKNILEDSDKKRIFSNLIKYLLPFVDDLDIEKFADKSLILKMKETYTKKGQYLPASLLSDGTINITALIIALYFEKKWLTIVEEPEKNIHPYLVSKVVEMMKDVSHEKQIVVTTHNPEMVKYAGLENILLVSRDKDGFSVVSKPSEKETVKTFLENDLGIEELYVDNLLG